MKNNKVAFIVLSILMLTQLNIKSYAQRTDKGVKISPDLFGIFFEDLNYAADGGLYAELVQNRSFEYSPSDIDLKVNPKNNWHFFTAWEFVKDGNGIGTVSLESVQPIHPHNPHYLVLDVQTPGKNGVGPSNSGYDGIVVRKGERYNFSVFLRLVEGADMPVKIQLKDNKEQVIAESGITVQSGGWHKYNAALTSTADTDAASLVILFQKEGKVAIDMVSLFPEKTFKSRKNGLRPDIAEAIAALKPAFMRFPGGCLAHGDGVANIYNWKNTIGPVEQRKGDRNIWNYHQSFGLGYFEYLQFCEDIGAKPIPVVAAGVSCQNSARTKGTGQECIPMENMQNYIRDVLDLVEYCNGPVTSAWGSKRAEAGHPAPFNLEYIGIGNEDKITPEFKVRFKMICEAVRAKYPEIKLIGTSGPFSDGEDFELGWKISKELNVDAVDEHYYKDHGWFLHNLERYDSYPRTGPKVYLGEYASWGSQLYNALAEAAFMTGLERNGDVVQFASYAPLLGRIGNTQWNPDLIYFDGKAVYPTVNYHVQQLFSCNRGDIYFGGIVHLKNEGLQASCVQDSKTGDVILKLVNPTGAPGNAAVDLKSFRQVKPDATLYILKGSKDAKNTKEHPENVKPEHAAFKAGKRFDYQLPPYSLSVIRIKTR